jgi:hypothetical protein
VSEEREERKTCDIEKGKRAGRRECGIGRAKKNPTTSLTNHQTEL